MTLSLLPVGRKSHKLVHLWLCSGRDFSITVQSISKSLSILEITIQALPFLLCNLSNVLLLDPENGAQVDRLPSPHHLNGRLQFSWKLLKLANHKLTPIKSWKISTLHRKWRYHLLLVGRKSRSCHSYRRRLHRHKVIILENQGNY